MKKYANSEDFRKKTVTNDGMFRISQPGISEIWQSKDEKILIVIFENGRVLMGICTKERYVTYYPLQKNELAYPIYAVLMDLDGTTVYSEEFWISVIEETMRSVANCVGFKLNQKDFPFVSGHSVSEHLQYCITKYFPETKLADALNIYYQKSKEMLQLLTDGKLADAHLRPASYLREFLDYLRKNHIKIGLVTSGVYEKAYPEIKSVCTQLGLGAPETVYDSIITAGNPLKAHQAGTMGELTAKPHPWLYLEDALVGLGISLEERSHVLGIEDSGAGVCALRAAGIPVVGMKQGNIEQGGFSIFCCEMCSDLKEVMKILIKPSDLVYNR